MLDHTTSNSSLMCVLNNPSHNHTFIHVHVCACSFPVSSSLIDLCWFDVEFGWSGQAPMDGEDDRGSFH